MYLNAHASEREVRHLRMEVLSRRDAWGEPVVLGVEQSEWAYFPDDLAEL
jgi:hypothetical protein